MNWDKTEGENRRALGYLLQQPVLHIGGYAAENAFRLLLAAAVGVFVARYLGAERLGLLSFSLSVFALAVPTASLGMRAILVREFSVTRDWRPLLVSALVCQLPTAIVVSAISAIVVMATRGFDVDSIRLSLALMPLPLLALHDTARALLEAKGHVGRVVYATLGAAILTSGLKVAAIAGEAEVWVFGVLITVEALLVAIAFARKQLQWKKVRALGHSF
jgi:O-antigen/teichoic acid export membrane protein